MKRIDFNIKDRKILYGILTITLVCIFTLTIAYAALNAVLTIQGSAQVTSANWDVHLANPKVINGSVTTTVPTLTTGKSLAFSTTLNMPGDFYEFTVDVVNSGTIDAMIENVVKTPELTAEQAKFLKYEVSYANGESIANKQAIAAGVTMPIKVRVEYRKDLVASDLPTGQVQLTLGLVLDYTQSDGTASSVTNNGVLKPVANGSIENIGTVVTIGSEQFHTIGTEGDNVKLLSMYNLMVGNKVTVYDLNIGARTMVPITNPTGLQSSDAIGIRADENGMPALPWIGTVAYATSDIHGTNYSDYSGSLIETYVNDYEVAIEAMGVNVESARLITKDELVNTFGCSESEKTCTCSAYPWIYSTTYWSASAYNSNHVWGVDSRGRFVNALYSDALGAGVRPVITISKSLF